MKKYTISNASSSNIKVCYKDNKGVLCKLFIPAYQVAQDYFINDSDIAEFEKALEFWCEFLVVGKTTKEKLADKNEVREEKRIKEVSKKKDEEIKKSLKKFNKPAESKDEEEYFIVEQPK